MIAVTNNKVYNFRQAQAGLLKALKHPEETLRITGADVLAASETPEAQMAVAQLALDESQAKPVRLRVFAALANSAKAHGNLLNDEVRDQVALAATQTKDLEIRTAASQALGALNLPSNQASKIIQAQAMK